MGHLWTQVRQDNSSDSRRIITPNCPIWNGKVATPIRRSNWWLCAFIIKFFFSVKSYLLLSVLPVCSLLFSFLFVFHWGEIAYVNNKSFASIYGSKLCFSRKFVCVSSHPLEIVLIREELQGFRDICLLTLWIKMFFRANFKSFARNFPRSRNWKFCQDL